MTNGIQSKEHEINVSNNESLNSNSETFKGVMRSIADDNSRRSSTIHKTYSLILKKIGLWGVLPVFLITIGFALGSIPVTETKGGPEKSLNEVVTSSLRQRKLPSLFLPVPIGIGLVGTVSLFIFAYFHSFYFYIPDGCEVIFRSGKGKEPSILWDRGCFVIPWVHKLIRIPTRTIVVPIDFSDSEDEELEAIITKDYLRIDVQLNIFVRIEKEPDSIRKIVDAFSPNKDEGFTTIESDKLIDYVRGQAVDIVFSVAQKFNFEEVMQEYRSLTDPVEKSLAEKLAEAGMTLDRVAVRHNFSSSKAYDVKCINGKRGFERYQNKLEHSESTEQEVSG